MSEPVFLAPVVPRIAATEASGWDDASASFVVVRSFFLCASTNCCVSLLVPYLFA
jgi:hypothetical protein